MEGDVVELRSGGPPMTIKSIDMFNGKEGAVCRWISKDNKLEQAVFAEHEPELLRSREEK